MKLVVSCMRRCNIIPNNKRCVQSGIKKRERSLRSKNDDHTGYREGKRGNPGQMSHRRGSKFHTREIDIRFLT
jgi:hypothetical protein